MRQSVCRSRKRSERLTVEEGETGKTDKKPSYELGHWGESAVLCGLGKESAWMRWAGNGTNLQVKVWPRW